MKSSKLARKVSEIHIRDMSRIARVGFRSVGLIGKKIRAGVLGAYRRGEDPVQIVKLYMNDSVPLLIDAMTVAFLQGRFRAFKTASVIISQRRIALASVYDGALDMMRRRAKLSPEQLGDLKDIFSPTILEVTRGMSAEIERKVQRKMAKIIGSGLPIKEGMIELRKTLDVAPHLLETLVRTQTQLAYNAARWQANQDPAIDEILWGYEYVTVGDDRVRSTHENLDGIKAEKHNALWDSLWPPNGFNCRCSTIEIFRDTKEKIPKGDLEVDPEWAFNSGQSYQTIINFGEGKFSPMLLESLSDVDRARISTLISKLKGSVDASEKRKIRRELRKLGHKGGTGKVPTVIPAKPKVIPVEPKSIPVVSGEPRLKPPVPSSGTLTIERAENRIKDNVRSMTGSRPVVSLKGIPPEVADDIANTIIELHQMFPSVQMGELVISKSLGKHTIGRASQLGRSIHLNQAEFQSITNLKKIAATGKKSGWTTHDDYRQYLVHEFGHLAHLGLSTKAQKAVAQTLLKTMDQKKLKEVGKYVLGTPEEEFAEIFSHFVLDKKPSEFVKEIMGMTRFGR